MVASLLAAYGGRLVVMHGSIVPEGLMKRELRYRELSIVRVVASGVDTATKLALAYVGAHGVPALRIWCFALGPIANTVVTTIGIQLCHAWRPRLQFSRAAAVRAARFTSALSGGELLYYVYTSADYLVVGAWFGKAAVGAYRLAYELVIDVVRLLSMITAEVAYPTFVRLAHDARAVGDQLLRFTRQNLIVLAPFLVFAALESDDLLHLLYPPLPAGAATAARILCVVGLARTLGFLLPPVLAGTGRASRVLVYNGLATIILPDRVRARRDARAVARLRRGRVGVGRGLSDRVRRAARDGAAARAAVAPRVRRRAPPDRAVHGGWARDRPPRARGLPRHRVGAGDHRRGRRARRLRAAAPRARGRDAGGDHPRATIGGGSRTGARGRAAARRAGR